jgi:dihydrolipoamide dehydrogenase
MGQADGMVKVVYNPESRAILGVHIVGPHAADLIAEAAALVHQRTSIDSAATELIHCHPTLSETLMAAFAAAPMN